MSDLELDELIEESVSNNLDGNFTIKEIISLQDSLTVSITLDIEPIFDAVMQELKMKSNIQSTLL